MSSVLGFDLDTNSTGCVSATGMCEDCAGTPQSSPTIIPATSAQPMLDSILANSQMPFYCPGELSINNRMRPRCRCTEEQ